MTTHSGTTALVAVDEAWFGSWRGPSILRLTNGLISYDGPADASDRGVPRLDGTVLAPFTDSHVHLGLIDAARLPGGGISRVVDLGWDPAVASTWLAPRPSWPDVALAGGLLGAPDGYPSRSGWAPPEAALPVSTASDAERVLSEMRDLGATVAKISLNAEAGPVWDDAVLAAVVDIAHALALPVAAHVQGRGQAARALTAGVDLFAHTPFSEKLTDDLIERLAEATTWISTLDIHGHGAGGRTFRLAVDNLRRFHAAGGRVRYGTDLGNGPLPVGLNGRELDALRTAGLDGDALLTSLVATDADEPSRRLTFVPTPRPPAGELIPWLLTATAPTADDLLERLR
ncbi:amidohydrolase family protein [Frondihabitans cladoniiphilus]|uniref:Amidohydrolase family protein n=1 Tax=Frondihabitans cladoniiphilus TaxID=715785 RepID=A0ABP8VTS6_9MICO